MKQVLAFRIAHFDTLGHEPYILNGWDTMSTERFAAILNVPKSSLIQSIDAGKHITSRYIDYAVLIENP